MHLYWLIAVGVVHLTLSLAIRPQGTDWQFSRVGKDCQRYFFNTYVVFVMTIEKNLPNRHIKITIKCTIYTALFFHHSQFASNMTCILDIIQTYDALAGTALWECADTCSAVTILHYLCLTKLTIMYVATVFL